MISIYNEFTNTRIQRQQGMCGHYSSLHHKIIKQRYHKLQ